MIVRNMCRPISSSLTLMKSGSFARDSPTHENVCGEVSMLGRGESPWIGPRLVAPSPCDCGLGGVVFSMGDSAGLGPGVALTGLKLGVVLAKGVFLAAEGLEVFVRPGEPLAQLRLGGSEA
jgi:hypothetical protein